MIPSNKTQQLRETLFRQALQKSLRVRTAVGGDVETPLCIYSVCKKRGVIVRFNDINMEGMYDRTPRPRIHLSAFRPLVRRNFNCAHELGHHEFGHGTSVDEIKSNSSTEYKHPNEILADAFAGYLMMPTLGIRRSFSSRGIDPERASSEQIYTIARNFGVGYTTLVNHLSLGMGLVSQIGRARLLRTNPREISQQFLEGAPCRSLIIVDQHWTAPTIDAEEGSLVWLPKNTKLCSNIAVYEKRLNGGDLYRAVKVGVGRLHSERRSWATYLRVSAQDYVGLAEYRHMEACDE